MPKDELAAAIALDEGSDDPSHSLLKRTFAMTEILTAYLSWQPIPNDGTHICTSITGLKPTSRGTVSIQSRNPADPPLLDPNYFNTEVDRFVWRTALRNITTVLTGSTAMGRDIIVGETPPDGFDPIQANSSDEYLDARVKAASG
jgi:choline dehydrogenase